MSVNWLETLPNPSSIVIHPCDLTVEEQVVALHEKLAEEFGTLDLWSMPSPLQRKTISLAASWTHRQKASVWR